MADNPTTAGAGERVQDPLDVAVVGGGVSGLYTAWRLLASGRYPKVGVFEMSQRFGGRLLTLTPPETTSLRAELGGMRFLTSQRLVTHIVKNVLDLETGEAPVSQPQNLAYLRDHRLWVKDLSAEPYVLPYAVAEGERTSVAVLMAAAITTVVTAAIKESARLRECLREAGYAYGPGMNVEVTELTRAQWHCIQRHGSWKGHLLRQWGFWNLLYQVMSPEAYSMVMESSGYDTIVSNWNAADAMPWFLADFGKVEYCRPLAGMGSIPAGLHARVCGLGGRATLDRELTHLELSDGLARLTFSAQDTTKPPPPAVFAHRVVLAMPRRSLERIGAGLDLVLKAPGVASMVQAVTPTPLFKLFCVYSSPWWKGLGRAGDKIVAGRSVTSIPVRQVYYFGTDQQTKRSLLMIYNDDRSIKYWIGFLRDPSLPFRPGEASHSGEQNPYMGQEWKEYRVPEMMCQETHRLLELMHGVHGIPEPIDAVFRDWSADPYGGGYNMWKIHADSYSVSENIVHPVEDLPVYICGEAYSHDQGWVEGALQTAEDMLTEFFSLKTLIPGGEPAGGQIAPVTEVPT